MLRCWGLTSGMHACYPWRCTWRRPSPSSATLRPGPRPNGGAAQAVLSRLSILFQCSCLATLCQGQPSNLLHLLSVPVSQLLISDNPCQIAQLSGNFSHCSQPTLTQLCCMCTSCKHELHSRAADLSCLLHQQARHRSLWRSLGLYTPAPAAPAVPALAPLAPAHATAARTHAICMNSPISRTPMVPSSVNTQKGNRKPPLHCEMGMVHCVFQRALEWRLSMFVTEEKTVCNELNDCIQKMSASGGKSLQSFFANPPLTLGPVDNSPRIGSGPLPEPDVW